MMPGLVVPFSYTSLSSVLIRTVSVQFLLAYRRTNSGSQRHTRNQSCVQFLSKRPAAACRLKTSHPLRHDRDDTPTPCILTFFSDFHIVHRYAVAGSNSILIPSTISLSAFSFFLAQCSSRSLSLTRLPRVMLSRSSCCACNIINHVLYVGVPHDHRLVVLLYRALFSLLFRSSLISAVVVFLL